MLHKILFALFCFISITVTAQETMTAKDGKQYKATNTWDFICEDYALGGILKVQVARTDKGGILKLSAEVSDNQYYIGGTVYLFLDDNSIITCTDKGLRENTGNFAVGYYTFSIPEMNRLKITAIKNVRFEIKGKDSRFSSQTGHFFSVNKKNYYDVYDKSVRNSFETEIEISSLYK